MEGRLKSMCTTCLERKEDSSISCLASTVYVSKKVCRFMSLMLSQPVGHIHSYDDIYAAVWPDSIVSQSSLLLLIHNVRRVLPENVKVYNVRGVGYFVLEE